MIRKHVDLIAIALLLGAVGICFQVRNCVVVGRTSARGVWLAPNYRGSHVMIREIPRIPFARD